MRAHTQKLEGDSDSQISGLHGKVAHRAIYSDKERWKRNQHFSFFFPPLVVV